MTAKRQNCFAAGGWCSLMTAKRRNGQWTLIWPVMILCLWIQEL
jgi:hypothetical protein